jgi:xylulose-5-phosphate/fructose-6-phosphate phosphoketolase
MAVRNDIDRFHLVMDVIDRVPGLSAKAATVRQRMVDARTDARAHAETYGEDPDKITDWTWSGAGAAG